MQRVPFIATDGFAFYAKAIHHFFGLARLYGRVIKIRKNDHVIKVERRTVLGA
jgi:hypothetical protein